MEAKTKTNAIPFLTLHNKSKMPILGLGTWDMDTQKIE